ncbi:MAG: hypothetical protein ACI81P_002521 [Neolewinella sp.]|jgi:hypothetical protein
MVMSFIFDVTERLKESLASLSNRLRMVHNLTAAASSAVTSADSILLFARTPRSAS